MKIAVCHPGKIGDTLYTLPTIRYLSKVYNCKIDFYTSEHCTPILKFMEHQDCISKAFVSRNYKIERYDMGIQPWSVPVDGDYDKVFQLGFRSVPDKALPEFIAESAGLDRSIGNTIYYDIKNPMETAECYIAIAPRGINSFTSFFENVISNSTSTFVVVGSKNENPFKAHDNVIDLTHLSFDGMAKVICNSKGFIGIMSSPLVIANGFNIPKYIPYTEYQWDMRHIVERPESKYTTNYSVEDCLSWLEGVR